MKAFNWHHRKPKRETGDRNKRNLIKVSRVKHEMFHQLFSQNGRAMTVHEIAHALNTIWCDPDIEFVAVRR